MTDKKKNNFASQYLKKLLMNRKLFLYLSAIIIISGCKDHPVRISGTLMNPLKGNYIYLDELMSNDMKTVDSVRISENGKFNFKRDIKLESFKDCSVIEYHTDKLIGISLYKQFDNQFVAYQFIWDYEDPKLSLGTVAQMVECETAKTMGCEYVYLLGGYELCCLYKSNYKGFEFWTGKEWSKDIVLYKKLVERDEKIKIMNYDV